MSQKRALVCGASQGIGLAIAQQLASDGVAVTLFARSADKLKQHLASLSGEGHDFLAADISRVDDWQEELKKRHKEKAYSILICNSGGPKAGPISQAEPSEFLQAMTNHLVANSLMTRTFMEQMKKDQFGRMRIATTRPLSGVTSESTLCRRSSSFSRPVKVVSPLAARACHGVASVASVISKTSTSADTPLTSLLPTTR